MGDEKLTFVSISAVRVEFARARAHLRIGPIDPVAAKAWIPDKMRKIRGLQRSLPTCPVQMTFFR
jgi:hypothetical protein